LFFSFRYPEVHSQLRMDSGSSIFFEPALRRDED